jgi:Cytochrome c oxidase subunit IV
VKTASRVAFGLALFLVVTGVVYALTSYEKQGTVQLLVLAVAFGYIAVVTRAAARRAEALPAGETPSVLEEQAEKHTEEQVAPTIWPVGFSVAAIALVLGVIVNHLLLIVGGVLFLAAAVGWLQDIRRQHAGVPPGNVHDEPRGPSKG